MKNLLKLSIRACLMAALVIAPTGRAEGQTVIDPDIFAQNAWLLNMSNPNANRANDFVGLLGTIKQSGVKYVRIGGIEPNWNMMSQTDLGLLVSNIKAAGMSPIIQVPFNCDLNTLTSQANNAASLVTLLNSGGSQSPSYCKYWIIGNETDGDLLTSPNYWGCGWNSSATHMQNIKTYITAFTPAMKNATGGQNIIIIGPELMFSRQPFFTSFGTGGTNDLTQLVDLFSFHYYPFSNQQIKEDYVPAPSRQNVIDFLETQVPRHTFSPIDYGQPPQASNECQATAVQNSDTYHSTLSQLNTLVSPKRIAITEANICHKNAVDQVNNQNCYYSQNDHWGGTGANSFLAGQFWAEMLALSMYRPNSNTSFLKFLNFWSVREGNTNVQSTDPFLKATIGVI